MNRAKLTAAGLVMVMGLNGCASTPMGPTVQVMPAPNKPFEQFQAEKAACKDYAHNEVSGQADSANNRAVGAALIGAALGAGLGAAAGGGRGAGTGAAVGGGLGTAVGAGESSRADRSIQGQYNNAFAECMASKGNQVQPMAHTVTVVHPVYAPPPVVYTSPPVVYTSPQGYAPPPGAVPAPPPGASGSPAYAPPPGASSGYAPPAGAVAPPANLPPPNGGQGS